MEKLSVIEKYCAMIVLKRIDIGFMK